MANSILITEGESGSIRNKMWDGNDAQGTCVGGRWPKGARHRHVLMNRGVGLRKTSKIRLCSIPKVRDDNGLTVRGNE